MAEKSITAANSVYLLTVRGLYTGTRLGGFSADAAFDTESATSVEVQRGVDGKLSAGFVFANYVQSITLNPDSDSNLIFETWYQQMMADQEIIRCDAVITLPAVRRKYIGRNGVLTGYKPMAGVARVLQPRPFGITWENMSPAPYSIL